uniref:Disease resistance N-terminal domain-containing protein n=1 Tax=Aegilops tauschii TaxID=37682 RepID=M8BZ78_AEGTA
MLTSVSGEINELGIKLRDLKNILADAKRRNTTDESIRWWVQELNRAMYDDVTDILERFQLASFSLALVPLIQSLKALNEEEIS